MPHAGGRKSVMIPDLACFSAPIRTHGDGGALTMAQPDDFKLIKQSVTAGGHKHITGEVDPGQRVAELGWLKAVVTNTTEVSYRRTERGKAAA